MIAATTAEKTRQQYPWRVRALCVALLALVGPGLVACGGRRSAEPASSPTHATSLPAGVDVAPAARLVPLAGDRDLRFVWQLDPGASRAGGVVDVARRTLVLIDLGYGSRSWVDRRRITRAARAITAGGVVTAREIGSWTNPRKKPADGVAHVLVAAPRITGRHVFVFTCTDLSSVSSIPAVHGGSLGRMEVADVDGDWRVVKYDNNAQWLGHDEQQFLQRCRSYHPGH